MGDGHRAGNLNGGWAVTYGYGRRSRGCRDRGHGAAAVDPVVCIPYLVHPVRDSVGKLKLALSKQLGPVTRTLVAGVLVLALPLLFACRVDKILSSATPKVALVLPANSVGLADSLRLIANVEVGGVTQPELRVFWTS